MKVSNIKDIQKFFDVVDSCACKVELVTGSLYLNFFQIATGFSPSGKKSPTVTNKTRICPILWVFLILNYHGNLKISVRIVPCGIWKLLKVSR